MIGAHLAKKALAGSFDALNQRDLKRFMSAWNDDGVFVYPGEVSASGTFQGKQAVEAWFRRFFEQFPKVHFDVQSICVQNIFDLTGTNIVSVHWNIRLTNRNGREGQNSGVTVVNVKRGKAFHAQDFLFDLGEDYKLMWKAP